MSRRFDDLFPEGIPAAEVRRDLFGVQHAGRVGTVVSTADTGVGLEFWDGSLWEFFEWWELVNADAIRAAIARST